MTPEERNRLAEQWLETALKPHNASPRTGLEARILAAIEAERDVPRSPLPVPRFAFRVSRLVWPVAAGLALVLGLGLSMRWHNAKPADMAANPASQPLQGTSGIASAETVAQWPEHSVSGAARPSVAEAAAHESVASARLKPSPAERAVQQRAMLMQRESPRLEQFPAPRPLSEQERLLLAYLRATPQKEILLVAQRQAEDELRRQKEFTRDSMFPATGAAALDGTPEEK